MISDCSCWSLCVFYVHLSSIPPHSLSPSFFLSLSHAPCSPEPGGQVPEGRSEAAHRNGGGRWGCESLTQCFHTSGSHFITSFTSHSHFPFFSCLSASVLPSHSPFFSSLSPSVLPISLSYMSFSVDRTLFGNAQVFHSLYILPSHLLVCPCRARLLVESPCCSAAPLVISLALKTFILQAQTRSSTLMRQLGGVMSSQETTVT